MKKHMILTLIFAASAICGNAMAASTMVPVFAKYKTTDGAWHYKYYPGSFSNDYPCGPDICQDIIVGLAKDSVDVQIQVKVEEGTGNVYDKTCWYWNASAWQQVDGGCRDLPESGGVYKYWWKQEADANDPIVVGAGVPYLATGWRNTSSSTWKYKKWIGTVPVV